MKNSLQLLILEDDIKTLGVILEVLGEIEEDNRVSVSVTILPDYKKVEDYINDGKHDFDLILLDRDCFLGGSFHTLNVEKFGPDKVIGISSVPDYNVELQKRGVKKIVGKDYSNLAYFKKKIVDELDSLFKEVSD